MAENRSVKLSDIRTIRVPHSWRFVKLIENPNIIDLNVLVRHQECYLLSEHNELIQENTDGSAFILGEIEDVMMVHKETP